MDEYTPLDLKAFYNAGIALLAEQGAVPIGPQQFRGLSFLIGTDPQCCFIAFGNGWQNAPLSIPIAGPAQSVIVAHRLLASGVSTGGPVGEPIAGYVFAYQNGDEEHIPIRDRFEIAEIPTAWGQLPFRAVPDQSDSLPARDAGRFDQSGERQAEVNQAELLGYYLWAWQNPHPEQPLAALTVIPAGPCFLIAGVTLGYSDEYPFVRSGARPFKITITDSLAATRPFELAVAVDRGVASFPYPLPRQSPEEVLADPLAAWGDELNEQTSPASAEIAALP